MSTTSNYYIVLQIQEMQCNTNQHSFAQYNIVLNKQIMNLCGSFTMPFPMLFHQIFLELVMHIGVSNPAVHLHETSDALFFLHGLTGMPIK